MYMTNELASTKLSLIAMTRPMTIIIKRFTDY